MPSDRSERGFQLRYAVNIRTLSGENPDFIEITEAAYFALSNGLNVLLIEPHKVAVHQGSDAIDGWQWLQYIIVRSVGLAGVEGQPASLVEWIEPKVLPK